MSSSTPRHAFTVPALPAQQCGITVDQAVIEALRTQIPVSRKESMRWVDDEFEVAARWQQGRHTALSENHPLMISYLVGKFLHHGTYN